MERVNIYGKKLGEGYVSPSEGGRVNRSYLNYHSGIPDLDKFLTTHKFSDLDAEFSMEVFEEIVAFVLYKGKKLIWQYSIKRESITNIITEHNQNLNIRKDSFVSGRALGILPIMPILGGIAAIAIDAIQTSKKEIPKDQIVLGSLFHLEVKNDQGESEKIIISCTDKNKVVVETFLKNIINFKEKVSKAGCYIATVCYGDSNCIEVKTFKKYRDQKLNKFVVGRLFIKIYYFISPSISRFLIGRNSCNHFIKTYFLNFIYNKIK